MASLRICTKCRTSYPVGSSCPNNCLAKYKAGKDKVYDKTKRKRSNIYWSDSWKQLTNICKNKCRGIDIYAYYVLGKISYGKLSHHIEPIEDNPQRTFDITNLIYVGYQTHSLIHKAYSDPKSKKEMQELLYSLLDRWKSEEVNL